MRQIFIFFSLLLLISACRNEDPEVLDIKDIMPISDANGTPEDTLNAKDSSDLRFYFNRPLLDSVGLKYTKAVGFQEALFPDRFGAKQMRKLKLISSDSTIFRSWSFTDSLKSEAAFYNWMDCYGKACKTIYISERKNLQKGSFLLLQRDTLMIHIENMQGISLDKWLSYYEGIEIKEWKFILHQGRNGKVQWYRKTKDELLKLEKDEDH